MRRVRSPLVPACWLALAASCTRPSEPIAPRPGAKAVDAAAPTLSLAPAQVVEGLLAIDGQLVAGVASPEPPSTSFAALVWWRAGESPRHGPAFAGADGIEAIARRPDGGVALTLRFRERVAAAGRTFTTGHGLGCIVVALGPDGTEQWATPIGPEAWNVCRSVAVRSDGTVVAIGNIFAGVTSPGPGAAEQGQDDAFVVELSAGGGELQRALVFGSACGDQGRTLVPAADGTLLVGGSFGDPGVQGPQSTEACALRLGKHTVRSVGNADGFVVLLDRELEPKWVRGVASPGFTVVKSAAVHGDGWVLGGSEQREPVPDGTSWPDAKAPVLGFVERIAADGTTDWRIAPDWLVAADEVRTVGDRIVAAGYYRGDGTAVVGGTPQTLASQGLGALALELDAEGAIARLWTCDGEGDDTARGLTFAGDTPVLALAASHGNPCVGGEGPWLLRLR